jgi:hypothetical protein
VREISCDESGYEGEKLIDTTTALFAHSSVTLDAATAAEVVAEIHARVKSPVSAYRAGHLLREKHRSALLWFLAPDGPLAGRGSVFLVDKAWLVVTRLAELLGITPADVDRSPYVLAAANDLLRAKDRPGVVDEFFRVSGRTHGRKRAELFREWLRADPAVNTVLDPLVPALVAATDRWGPVTVLHDRQIMLPPRRVERIRDLSGGRLGDVRFLDIDRFPQIQVADMLAGTVRWIVERGDAGLTDLARPFVDPRSLLDGSTIRSRR